MVTPSEQTLEAIVAALSHGPATARQLAGTLGLPYSTLTPRLRLLHSRSRIERSIDPDTRQAVWRLPAKAAAIPATAGPTVTGQDQPTEPTIQAGTLDPQPAAPGMNVVRIGAADAGTESGEHTARRPKGTIRAAILTITRDRPGSEFKVSDLAKALDGTSAGAIANAAHKLVVSGDLICVREKPATFQAA